MPSPPSPNQSRAQTSVHTLCEQGDPTRLPPAQTVRTHTTHRHEWKRPQCYKEYRNVEKKGGIHEQIPVRKFPFHQNRRHFSPPTRIESRTKTECVRICFTLKSAQKTDFPIRTTLPQILCAIPIRIKNAFQLRTSQSRLLSVWIIPSVPLLKSAAARV